MNDSRRKVLFGIGLLAGSGVMGAVQRLPKASTHANDFSQAWAAILAGGRAQRKAWNVYFTIFEGGLWAFGFQGTGVKIHVVDVEDMLAQDWIIL